MNKDVIKKYTVPVFDFMLIVNAYILAVLVKADFNLLVFSETFIPHTSSIIIAIAVYITLYILFKIRFTVWHLTSISEFFKIFSMNLVGAVVLSGLRLANLLPGLSISVIVTTTIFNTLVSFLARVTYRFARVSYIQRLRTGKTERILIYGAGSAGRLITSEIVENKNYNYEVIGILDDDPKLKGSSLLRTPILGGLNVAEKVIEDKMIDTVIVAMPSVEKQKRQRILQALTPLDVEIKVVSSAKKLLEGFDFRQSLRKVNVLDLLGRQEIVIDDEEIEHMLKDKVVLVTGAGGSIGSELVRQIVNRNAKKVVLIDFNETGLYSLEQELKIRMREGSVPMVKIVPIIRSIRDYDGLEQVFNEYKPEYVYHAAAHKHVPLMESVPEEAIKNNILGTHNLIQLSIKYKVDKFVNISTDKAVNPTNVMGATKRFIEMMMQAYNSDETKFVAVRFGNVLGSNGSVVPVFQKQIEAGGPLTLTHPEITRFFMTIPEAVSLVLQAGVYAEGGEIFVLDMGEEVKIKDMAYKMIELSGLRPHRDIAIEYIGLRPGEKLYEELLIDIESMYKTPNDLIYIEKPSTFDVEDLEEKIKTMEKALVTPNYNYKKLLAQVVPTYYMDER